MMSADTPPARGHNAVLEPAAATMALVDGRNTPHEYRHHRPGRIKERYLRDAIDEYSKRLSRFCKLSIIEVADEKTPEHATPGIDELIKRKEGERIAKHIKDGAYVIALAIDGQMLGSERFAEKLDDLALHGASHIQFIIGGSLGLAPEILSRADWKLSFSPMTFPHQLMRVILLEQVYRAFKINAHEPYHK